MTMAERGGRGVVFVVLDWRDNSSVTPRHVGCYHHQGYLMTATELNIGILIAVALAALLWIPYFIKEIRDGKRDFGPLRRLRRDRVTVGPTTPSGAADINPGRTGDPAPGQPDAQADPYSDRAQRNAPRVKS